MRLSYKDCTKKGLWTLEDRTIGGKLYNDVQVYHFEVCKNCKEDCNGRIQYGAVKKAMDRL